jgi:malonyl-CoA/methylmalonyl-CoA synthetase
MPNHLLDRLFARADPDAPALVGEFGDLSHGDLRLAVERYANALVDLGVAPGDRVAVQVEKSAANLLVYLASIHVGAVYLPLNTAYTLTELAYFLTDAAPALVVCDPAMRDAVAAIAGNARVETLDAAGEGSLAERAATARGGLGPVPRGPDDLAAICYTSGTTGRSKGAMLSHGNLASNADTLCELWRFTADDVLIHALPIYHVHGLFVATNVALISGASMVLQARFDPAAVLAAMPSATALMGVPTFYTRLLAQPGLNRDGVANMRLFISGSAPLLAQTHHDWSERTGHAILERYGMTETGMNTSNPYDGDRIAGTVGMPLPGVDLRLMDGDAEVATGDVGMIEVRGPNVLSGYWRNAEKTTEAFRPDGFFITGDLGQRDARGYISIVGRDKDLIITGGLNVYPKEVEGEIDALPGVVESAVIGLPHDDLGEAVTAIVAGDPASRPSEAAVVSALKDRLARFKQPRRVIFVDELPRNAMGKVRKALLRQEHADLYRGSAKPAGASLLS